MENPELLKPKRGIVRRSALRGAGWGLGLSLTAAAVQLIFGNTPLLGWFGSQVIDFIVTLVLLPASWLTYLLYVPVPFFILNPILGAVLAGAFAYFRQDATTNKDNKEH